MAPAQPHLHLRTQWERGVTCWCACDCSATAASAAPAAARRLHRAERERLPQVVQWPACIEGVCACAAARPRVRRSALPVARGARTRAVMAHPKIARAALAANASASREALPSTQVFLQGGWTGEACSLRGCGRSARPTTMPSVAAACATASPARAATTVAPCATATAAAMETASTRACATVTTVGVARTATFPHAQPPATSLSTASSVVFVRTTAADASLASRDPPARRRPAVLTATRPRAGATATARTASATAPRATVASTAPSSSLAAPTTATATASAEGAPQRCNCDPSYSSIACEVKECPAGVERPPAANASALAGAAAAPQSARTASVPRHSRPLGASPATR